MPIRADRLQEFKNLKRGIYPVLSDDVPDFEKCAAILFKTKTLTHETFRNMGHDLAALDRLTASKKKTPVEAVQALWMESVQEMANRLFDDNADRSIADQCNRSHKVFHFALLTKDVISRYWDRGMDPQVQIFMKNEARDCAMVLCRLKDYPPRFVPDITCGLAKRDLVLS